VTLTLGDLQTLIHEIRKPVKSEKEIRDEARQEADREQMAATLKLAEENRLARIKNCTHMRSNGSTTAVYISDLGKLYCQACAGWIDPRTEPEVWNRIYQLAI
jgi:hypothetical protein